MQRTRRCVKRRKEYRKFVTKYSRVLAVDAWARAHAGFDRFRPNSITSVEFGGIRSGRWNLVEFDQSVGIYLSSVSPRHSYCNWASPVALRKATNSHTPPK